MLGTTPNKGGFGPFGPEVSRGVSERVSPKIGVSERVSGGVSRAPGPFGPRPSECPKGVPRVSPERQQGVRTLQRHSRDTFWTHCRARGPQGPRDTPLSDTPIFGDTLSGSGGWGCLKPKPENEELEMNKWAQGFIVYVKEAPVLGETAKSSSNICS